MDASEQALARRALEASEARFRKLIDSAPDAIVVSRDATVLFANPAAFRLLGYDEPSQLVGRPMSVFMPVGELGRARERMREVIRGAPARPTAYSAFARDGRALKVEVTSIPIDWDGAPALLAIVRDVTERERLREELAHADRMVALGTLAAGVAHELNNPLAYVTLGLDALERTLSEPEIDETGRARAARTILEMREGLKRAVAIVRDLQTFAREQPEESAAESSELQLVIASAARLTAHEVELRARLVIQLEPAPPIAGSALRLEQVFVNLLLNAAQSFAKFHPENLITVRGHVLGDGRVRVEVRDNGVGIPPEHRARVFDPFFTTKPVGSGTGLGLPICHSIVARLGGEISVESPEQPGTTTAVTLPCAVQRGVSEAPPPPMPRAATPARARILVVDDEVAVGRAMKRLLGKSHDVETVTSGEEALQRLRRQPDIDVILCDLSMPVMTGMDVFEALAKEGRGFERRIVFMSGAILDHELGPFVKRVPNPFLAKPFEIGALEAAIQDQMGRTGRGTPGT